MAIEVTDDSRSQAPGEEEAPKSENKMGEISPELLEALKKELAKEEGKTEGSGPNETVLAIRELVTELKKKPDSEVYGGRFKYVSEENIDPDDLLPPEERQTFFAYSSFYIIVDDLRQGHPVQTPFGNEIVFKYAATKKRQSGKEYQLSLYSTYTCMSRKELKWLKEHTMYGIKFFERNEAGASDDAIKAAKLAKFMLGLKYQGQHALQSLAQQHDIKMMEDLDQMRIVLANHFADRELEQEQSASQTILKESRQAKELLASKE